MRLTSCTGFIMMSYIVTRYRFLFRCYKLRRTYLLSNFWGTLFAFSNSVYNNFYYWSCYYKICGYCNLWAHLRVRYVVSIRNTVVLSGFYPTDCQISPFEVRINHFSSNRWWLAHLNRINLGSSATIAAFPVVTLVGANRVLLWWLSWGNWRNPCRGSS